MAQILSVTPYLRLSGGVDAIDFYRRAFGAEEIMRLVEPGGRLGHAELRIGPATISIADEYPEYNIVGPKTLGGTCMSMQLRVDDLDSVLQKAVEAGATVIREPQDQFYGERCAAIRDPFGHEWLLGQEIEKVSKEEMQRRFTAMLQGSSTLEE